MDSDIRAMLDVLDMVLTDAKAGVLATVDADGLPRMRWMTPALVRGRDGYLYAVTSPKFAKTAQLQKTSRAEWMIQTRSLDQIVTVSGQINIIDNPAVKAEVLEAIGGRLGTFWKLNPNESDLIVLETMVERIVRFRPVTGEKTSVELGVDNG